MKISASHLANKFSIPEQSFIDSLNILDNMGIISFQQAIAKETVLLTTPRVDADKLVLNYKLINESYLNLQHKLDKMTEFVFTNDCRFRNILTYFGENVLDYKCGKCDNCTNTGRLKDSSTAFLSEIIIETLEEAKEDLPENFLVNLLRGEKVKESAALFKHFGTCKKFTTSEIKGVLSVQVAKGKIIKRAGRKNYLSLPEAHKSESEKSTSVDDSVINQTGYDNELYLFNQLREVRKKAAERFLQSGYLICPDNVLREVARIQPKNKYEMLGIAGFNGRMFNKIGNDFLEIINSYKPKEIKRTDFSKNQELPPNIIEIKNLIGKKYTLKEIAETIKLTEAVVSMQVESLVEFEPATDISSLIKKEIIWEIIEEVKNGFENLKDLKERLPSRITYPEIRIALAKFRADSQLQVSNAQRKQ
jgi:ATP-dependent DNA helicase RecQ